MVDKAKVSPVSGLPPASPEIVVRLLTSILCIYKLFGFVDEGWKSKRTLDHWRECIVACHNDWVGFTKYKLAAFYSVYTNQPLPKVPKGIFCLHGENQGKKIPEGLVGDRPGVLLGGRAHRWLRVARNTWDFETFLQFLFSVKQTKKGMPRPTKAYLDRGARETVDKLTTPRPEVKEVRIAQWGDGVFPTVRINGVLVAKTVVTKLDIVNQIERTVRELYEGKRLTFMDVYKPYFPSTSANYNRSRNEGGAVESILELIEDAELFLDVSNSSVLVKTELPGLDIRLAGLEVGELGLPRGFHAMYSVDDSALQQNFIRLYDAVQAAAVDEFPTVEPVSLPEALKVRVISKGPPLLYTALKPVQRFTWRVLADHPAFLIGGSVNEWVIQNRLGKRLQDGEGYLSGDYAAATDELCSWVSNEIVAAISRVCEFSVQMESLFTRSLTGHEFVDGRVQCNGQLMGSITSFPVLCIANAMLCRYSFELGTGRKVTLMEWPGLVNGDDIAMRCDGVVRDLWSKITGFAGLRESVGKTYFSREFVEMNSRVYMRLAEPIDGFDPSAVNNVHRPQWFRAVGFVNLGLLKGVKRSGLSVGKSSLYGDDSIGARARDLYSSAPPGLRDRCMEAFVSSNKKLLDTIKLPWFAPEWLGGVGLPDYFDSQGNYHGLSVQDLCIAQRILRNWSKERPIRETNGEWQIRRLVEKFAGIQKTVIEDVGEEAEARTQKSDEFFGECCVSLLMKSTIQLKHLREKLSDRGNSRGFSRAYNHNLRLWRRNNIPGRYRNLMRTASIVKGELDIPLVEIYDVDFVESDS